MPSGAAGWNIVLSFGDLSFSSGYRTRVLGELKHLDHSSELEPVLLVFDRRPDQFAADPPGGACFRAIPRRSVQRFYSEIAALARQKPIRVVHAHNLYSAALAISARPFYGYRVVLDYHGRIPEEYVYLGKGGAASRKALEFLERWAVRRADHVVVVSEKLSSYLQHSAGIRPDKISVIPCCANSAEFRWDARIRSNARSRLGLSDRFVCLHLGSFFEWYEPELLIDLFRRLRCEIPAAHLLVVTRTVREVKDYLTQRLEGADFSVTEALHHEVPELLNAADLGALLLRQSSNIRTSSPAKFAEYLNCGLPVAITPEVGDFSSLVTEARVGFVFDPELRRIDRERVLEIRNARQQIAERCVEAGAALTWQAMSEPIANAFLTAPLASQDLAANRR